jgi:hypothetical protein
MPERSDDLDIMDVDRSERIGYGLMDWANDEFLYFSNQLGYSIT